MLLNAYVLCKRYDKVIVCHTDRVNVTKPDLAIQVFRLIFKKSDRDSFVSQRGTIRGVDESGADVTQSTGSCARGILHVLQFQSQMARASRSTLFLRGKQPNQKWSENKKGINPHENKHGFRKKKKSF